MEVLLRGAPLFNSFTDTDLAPISAASRLVSLKLGTLLFRERDPSQHFFW